MSKFIVTSTALTPIQENAITSFLQSQRWEVWHWYQGVWLVSGVPETWTPFVLHKLLEETEGIGQPTVMVMRVSDPIVTWGRAPEAAWPWIRENWSSLG